MLFKTLLFAASLGLGSAHPSPNAQSSKLSARDLESKARLFPEPDALSILNKGFLSENTNTHNGQITHWASGDQWEGVAPQRCLDEALGPRSDSNPIPKCALKDLSVFSVQYDDCSRPWVMCRCADAEMSEATMVAEFGRLPPRLRSWVRHIIAFSGEDENGNVGTGAGSSDDIIVFYGTAGTPTIFIHEAAHSIDQGFSGEQDWEDTYESDTCIPDNYATSSPAENFAQVTVTVMAMKNTGSTGGFDPMSCMANQFNSVWDTFGSQLTVEGDQECDLGVRREDSPTVAWVYRGTKAKRDVYTNPAIEWFNVEH